VREITMTGRAIISDHAHRTWFSETNKIAGVQRKPGAMKRVFPEL
jgi:hypothetical protein